MLSDSVLCFVKLRFLFFPLDRSCVYCPTLYGRINVDSSLFEQYTTLKGFTEQNIIVTTNICITLYRFKPHINFFITWYSLVKTRIEKLLLLFYKIRKT